MGMWSACSSWSTSITGAWVSTPESETSEVSGASGASGMCGAGLLTGAGADSSDDGSDAVGSGVAGSGVVGIVRTVPSTMTSGLVRRVPLAWMIPLLASKISG